MKPPLVQDSFDLRHGTDTGGIEPLWKFHIRSSNRSFGFCYQPTDEKELVDAVNFLSEDLRAFTFVDLGCGKGRALLVASNLGFEQVIGVEFARELNETVIDGSVVTLNEQVRRIRGSASPRTGGARQRGSPVPYRILRQ